MKLSVFQIYFSPEQVSQLSPLTTHYDNDKLTPYFENGVIVDLYNKGKIHEADYFGVLSWRIEQKNNLSLNVLNNITPDHNLYSFRNIVLNHPVIPVGCQYHPAFGPLFKRLMEVLGLDYDRLYRDLHYGYYQNAVIASREIYLDYFHNFLKPCINYIDSCTDQNFLNLLRSDPLYSRYPPGHQQKLMAHIGTPHYQYHTFILERLWSVYVMLNKQKLVEKLL